jgi:hypothetical protein
MRTIDPYRASEDEAARLLRTLNKVLAVFRDSDLNTADVMNLLINLVAEVAVVECIDRESFIATMGKTYDLHLANDAENETIN